MHFLIMFYEHKLTSFQSQGQVKKNYYRREQQAQLGLRGQPVQHAPGPTERARQRLGGHPTGA